MELARKLASSGEARACVATQWFRFAFARLETAFAHNSGDYNFPKNDAVAEQSLRQIEVWASGAVWEKKLWTAM